MVIQCPGMESGVATMTPTCQAPSCGSLAYQSRIAEARIGTSRPQIKSSGTMPSFFIASSTRLSSLSKIAGSSFEDIRIASGGCCHPWGESEGRASVIRAGTSKQKKKAKEKKKSAPSDKKWKFDELMLVWDDVFTKVCEDRSIATALYEFSRNGNAQHGRGCILMEESVVTRPWGAASGFTFKSRYTALDAPELPLYSSNGWSAKFVPREFLLDPSKAPSAMDSSDMAVQQEAAPVVNQEALLSVLRGMDRTRLLGLLEDPETQQNLEAGAKDAGGEQPCNFNQDELVMMLVVVVDGQPAIGADVLKAFPTLEDNGDGSAGNLWTLKLRDDLPA